MTLGRTSSGAIKIKTDGGLRAVECACCSCEATCSCSPFCGFTQLKITPPPPDWPTPFIIVNGCNDGSFFCDLFGWSYPTILSVSVDTDVGIALFASDYAGNGSKSGGTPFGTYSNGITIEPYVP
jgi:hypothetical protein